MSIKIGDLIYYKEERGILYHTVQIVGETSRSWLAMRVPIDDWMLEDVARWARKIPKSLKGYILGTKRDANIAQWSLNHRYNVSTVLQGQNAEVILKVAKLIGYTKLPEE